MSFDDLIQVAQAQELTGWDFSWLNTRTVDEPLPWDYRALVLERLRGEKGRPCPLAMLDMETGGGEFFSSLAPFPPVAWATEGYPPNIPLARARLEPLGIRVADVSEDLERLPFANETFDLVINRHGSTPTAEIERVLRPGGRFLTQQVGGQNCIDLNHALQDEVTYEYLDETLDWETTRFRQAGLRVIDAREAFPRWTFKDIAGVVFYLKAIPWQLPGFSVEAYRERLLGIHNQIEQTGGFTVREHRLLLEATKEGGVG
jgi:SAM-dependent methyltransferase